MSLRVINGHKAKLCGIPSYWTQTKMRRAVGQYQLAKNEDPNPVVLSLTKTGVRVKTDLAFGKSTENYVGHQIVEPGQFVFTPRDFDATPILCGLSPTRGCISNLYMVFDVAEGIHPRFLEYYFWGLKHGYDYFAKLSHGMRYSFNREQFERIPLVFPDQAKQEEIVLFLDRETSRIDDLIAEKGNFIALLREKRVAEISRAVTKGLDAHAPMKPSGQDWLGDVPTHWHIKKAKHLFNNMARPVEEDDGIITAFRDGQVCLRSRRRTGGYTFAEKEVGYQRIHEGDLVIHTMDAFAGAVGVSEDTGKATGEYAVCTPRDNNVNCHYFAMVLRCMALRNYIFILCPSVRERAPRFRFIRFAPVPLPVPPREEQDRIMEAIDRETARIDGLIRETQRSIELLKEKRSALITAAVTGKIDVRSAA